MITTKSCYLLSFTIGIFFFYSCGEKKEEIKSDNPEKPKLESVAVDSNKIKEAEARSKKSKDKKSRVSYKEAFQMYESLQSAFVKSDSREINKAAFKIKGAFLKAELDGGENKLTALAGKIERAKDIEEQRKYFSELTEVFSSALKIYTLDNTVYVIHCPMAFDNKGANWLSSTKEVNNPYFGSKMLKCGEVQSEIK